MLIFSRNLYLFMKYLMYFSSIAVTSNKPEILDYILSRGQSPDEPANSMRNSALQIAVMNNYLELARVLMKHGADVFITDAFGRDVLTYIHSAEMINTTDPSLKSEASCKTLLIKFK